MIISRSKSCPSCGDAHDNLCFITYEDGYHCYACGLHKSTIYDYKPEQAAKPARPLIIPSYNTNFSPSVKKWLYSYYLDDTLLRKYNIYYCNGTETQPESILYLFKNTNGDIKEYQRRFFPKAFFSTSGVKQQLIISSADKSTLVLVEDYLSYVRIAEHAPAMCLFGTSLKQEHIATILTYKNIVVSLDNDQAGLDATSKIMLQLKKAIESKPYQYHSCNVSALRHAHKQLKELSNVEIKTLFLSSSVTK